MDHKALDDQDLDEDVFCPECGAEMDPDKTACPECGAEYGFYCPECDEEIPADATVCPYCGAELDEGFED
ncbi:MAG: zinc-ribbon domain-containing protein, partial [Anaerolineae bacterium]